MVEVGYSKRFACLKMTILSLFMSVTLASCGIRGPLETPPPLFGGDSKAAQDTVTDQDLDSAEDDNDGFIDLDVESHDSLADL